MEDVDVLHDSVVRATVYRERYSRGVYTRIINLLADAEAETLAKLERRLNLSGPERNAFVRGRYTTRRLQTILDQIRELSKRVRQIVNDELNSNIRDLVSSELAFSKELLGSLELTAVLGEGVTLGAAYSAVKAQPLSGRHLRDFVKDFEPNVRKRMLQALRTGYVTGATTPEIARGLRDTFDITHRAATTITRTAMTHTANVAYEMQYEALGATHVIWTSTLDGRVSQICRGLSESKYKIGVNHPSPPAHANCRSILRPWWPGADDIGITQPFVRDTRAVKDIPKSERKGKIGQVKGPITYDAWLRRQPVSFQRDILTKTEFELFSKGKKLSQFVDKKTQRALTSAELRKKYSGIITGK